MRRRTLEIKTRKQVEPRQIMASERVGGNLDCILSANVEQNPLFPYFPSKWLVCGAVFLCLCAIL